MDETQPGPDGIQSLSRPILVWDGDCDFCRFWVTRWKGITQDSIEYVTSREVADRLSHIPDDTFRRSVVLAYPDKTFRTGAHAVLAALATVPGIMWPLWAYDHLPFVRWISEAFYRLVARNREVFYRLTKWFWDY